MVRRVPDLARVAAVLERARDSIGPAQRALDGLVAHVEAARADVARVHDAGLALELVRRKKLYRLRDHASFAAFVRALGISVATAYKWRVIATQLDAETLAELGIERAYERVRSHRARRARGMDEAEAVAARLAHFGVEASVTPLVRRGRVRVRVELSAEDWPKVLKMARGGRPR